jgi:hypothetical protein
MVDSVRYVATRNGPCTDNPTPLHIVILSIKTTYGMLYVTISAFNVYSSSDPS